MASRNAKKSGNQPKTRDVNFTYSGYTVDAVVKTWSDDSETADITISVGKQELFKIWNVRIVEGKKGDFLGYPSRQGNDGNYYKHCMICDEELEQAIIDHIA